MTDITRKRGDTYANVLTVKRNGVAVDITGCTFTLTVDTKPTPPDTSTNVFAITGVIVDATAGRVGFSPSESQSDRVGTFFYDVQMIDTAGKKRTIKEGKYIFKQDITK